MAGRNTRFPGPYPYDPSADVTETAMRWVQDLVRERLRHLAITPARLEATVGDKAATWRNKLNGTRAFLLEDLLRISIALDGDLFASLPFTSDDLFAYFPPTFRDHLSHDHTGMGLPSFTSAPTTWTDAAENLSTWLTCEIDARRTWLLTPQSLGREVLAHLDTTGLPSTQATLAATTDSSIAFEWIAESVSICCALLHDPATATLSSSETRTALAEIATALVASSTAPNNMNALVLVGPGQLIETTRAVLRLPTDDASEWSNVSLAELHRLGHPNASDALPTDITVQATAFNAKAGLLWLTIK